VRENIGAGQPRMPLPAGVRGPIAEPRHGLIGRSGEYEISQCSMCAVLASRAFLLRFCHREREARHMDLTLRLNMLVVFAVFAFVGAILVGAF
jgi:hypothetical protein